jgi:hypothetical protein
LKAVENETGAGDRAVAKMRLVAEAQASSAPGREQKQSCRSNPRAFRLGGRTRPTLACRPLLLLECIDGGSGGARRRFVPQAVTATAWPLCTTGSAAAGARGDRTGGFSSGDVGEHVTSRAPDPVDDGVAETLPRCSRLANRWPNHPRPPGAVSDVRTHTSPTRGLAVDHIAPWREGSRGCLRGSAEARSGLWQRP